PPYTYAWNTGVTGSTITGIAAGTYQVEVTDFYGCQINETIIVNQPDQIVLEYTMRDVTCYGYRDGAVLLTATGGTPSYSFSVYDGTAYTSGSSHFSMAAGTYTLLVQDNNDCADSETIEIYEPSAMTGSYFYSNPSCIGNNDGYIEILIMGGTEPYLYGWNENYFDSPIISILTEGAYDIIVVDANNCELDMGVANLIDVDEDCLRIPNAFTPNGDGPNDTWIIENLELFPGAYVYVYNRWGQELYKGRQGDEWDGKYNGRFVPSGTYLYVVNLYNGSKSYVGTVNVIY
ncbi:MAG TPA: gliding motility-associated C-terminal domain-containing protein, partial [Bacteroidales bacterium]|nr:gliding motility-associated C-terminal domain-containing protein [Bacteroidales bacterium]